MSRIPTVRENWDVFPKVVLENKETMITVRPIGKQSAFPKAGVKLVVSGLHDRKFPLDEIGRRTYEFKLIPDADGCLRFSHAFTGEQEHFLRVYSGDEGLCQLSVYSVKEDLYGLIPLMGDQHIHTLRSDGGYDPAVVAANFRKQGNDYIAITDHHNYIGSLEAIDDFKDVDLDFKIFPGEEVHMPDAEIHVVNFGGRYSVNAITQGNVDIMNEKNDAEVAQRHADKWQVTDGGAFPGTISDDEFRQKMIEKAASMPDVPQNIPKVNYATFVWVCEQIRKTGGLAIFAHPYWIYDLYHVDEAYTDFIFKQKDFDAFEVLGGESYFEQNGQQTAHYYDARTRGMDFPIVGSSDTHEIYYNRNAFIASTIVFARSDSLEDIHAAIRGQKSVAVDWISPKEPRLVGDYRLIKYAWFLMTNYFPIHNKVCLEEGQAMLEYACGEREQGERMLNASKGRIPAMWKKYFSYEAKERK